ncbi:hypothetical protein QSJ19_11045 [Gordonia sp. ABSL11-1]|nr:hypothetical protein [Gordonia sp. ABSL11-1]MDL9946120.1 hypothetical protein [Gordonia sp. ABSL11-1]
MHATILRHVTGDDGSGSGVATTPDLPRMPGNADAEDAVGPFDCT